MSSVGVQKLHTLAGHRDCVYTLAAGGEPNVIFSGSGDGMVVQWDLKDPGQGVLIAKLPHSVYALFHHPKSDVVIAGHNYEGIHLLDWKNKKEVGSLQLSKAAIFDIFAIGDHAVIASGDGTVTLIDVNRLSVIAKNSYSEKSARCIAWNPATKQIAVGYSDNFIRVMDENLSLVREWRAHENSVFALEFTPDGRYLMSGSRDARLKLWDGSASFSQAVEVVAHMYAINDIEFSPDGKHFVTCSMDKSIKVWNLEEMKLLKVIDRSRHAGHGTSVNKLLWTTHGDQLVSASDDRTISIWHIIF
jgi:WD40 repeat protein